MVGLTLARNITIFRDTGHYVLLPPAASLASESFDSRVRQIPSVILPPGPSTTRPMLKPAIKPTSLPYQHAFFDLARDLSGHPCLRMAWSYLDIWRLNQSMPRYSD